MQPNSKFLLNMETKDELLSEGEKYFEKVMQDFNQNRKGRNLRKYCNDEGIDYKWLSEYKRTYGATKTASATKNSTTDGISFTALDVIESKMTPEEPRKEMFLLSNAVQSEIYIYDKENDDQRTV